MRTIFLIIVISVLNIFQSRAQIDKGIGVLFFIQSDPMLANPAADTVLIYCKRNERSKIVDQFYFTPTNRFKALSKTDFESASLIEFDNETFGLPIISITNDGEWFEVIYNKNEKPGYIKRDMNKLGHYRWRDLLVKRLLFFESAYDISFFDEPDGTIQEFLLTPDQSQKFDYIMKPLTVNNQWMKVEVTTPSDYCKKPKDKRTGIFWIKYLDNTNRPLVWYFPRGC